MELDGHAAALQDRLVESINGCASIVCTAKFNVAEAGNTVVSVLGTEVQCDTS